MKHLKNLRKDFDELTIDHIKDILMDPIDRDIINLRTIRNLELESTGVPEWRNSYVDFNGNTSNRELTKDHIFLNVAITSHDNFTKSRLSVNANYAYEYSMEILKRYLRRIYNDYNVDIFIRIMPKVLNASENEVSRCNIFILPSLVQSLYRKDTKI